MLVIRLQRTGRSGHAQYRIVVQDSRQTPTSGRVVASLGHYDPHTKVTKIDAEKAKFYIANGAQPSNRITTLLKKEGVKLPSWVEARPKDNKAIKHIDKLRKNRPAAPAVVSEPVAEDPITSAELADKEPEQEPVATEVITSSAVEKPAVDKTTSTKPAKKITKATKES